MKAEIKYKDVIGFDGTPWGVFVLLKTKAGEVPFCDMPFPTMEKAREAVAIAYREPRWKYDKKKNTVEV